jgi:hypothetical protein
MTIEDLRQEVLTTPDVRAALAELQARFIVGDLRTVREEEPVSLDWNRLLMLASVLAGGTAEQEIAAALRISQGCLISPEAGDNHRAAASVLLERMGNTRSVVLAEARELLAPSAWRLAPIPLQLDVMRRRLELSISTGGRRRRPVNPFQRRFWDLVEANDWVSVSAPTSTGKSWIVMRWFERLMATEASFRGFYIVPTRALVEEVALALAAELPSEVVVHTIPWDEAVDGQPREVYVMTQERAHLLLQRFGEMSLNIVFVDEAQKFADDSRGVLLQRVLADIVRRNPSTQVIFASPMSSNPGLLIKDAPSTARTAAEVVQLATVNQSVLWADPVFRRPKHWRLRVPDETSEIVVGSFDLAVTASRVSQRLPMVAFSLAGDSTGNVVYVNGAADAEKAALQIAELLGEGADASEDEDVAALRELVTGSIHQHYSLAAVLRRRVAFHYGNMPLLVRTEIERLFRLEAIKYLVCTSTLLEGVNLPCRNLFVRGPRRGRGNPMAPADFWNLAGRAGRWGTEFQGNIVCVDAADRKEWPDPPRTRQRTELRRAADEELRDLPPLLEHIRNGAPIIADDREHEMREAMLSLLAVVVAQGDRLEALPGLEHADRPTLSAIESELAAALSAMALPVQLLERHTGISPQAMNRMMRGFADAPDISALLLDEPAAPEAAESYQAALAACQQHFGAPFGADKRQWQLAYLITDWMRGRPLNYLIRRRIELSPSKKTDAVIRETMADVENVARFHAPKFLACYLDLLRLHLDRLGLEALAASAPEIDMLLELGVSQPTQMTLLALGLSRSSAIAVTEFMLGENLSRQECIDWLRAADLDVLPLPALVRRELAQLRDRYSPSTGSHAA